MEGGAPRRGGAGQREERRKKTREADARACAVAGGFPRAALGGGQPAWDEMTWHAVRGVAGLAQYLGDAMPPGMR